MATRQITNLDFSQIKSELIEFIKNDPTFTDYNFEGSALNTLMDILAYNTYYNAFYGNMVHNEGFVDTAQKRSSLVSRAKELGYVPRSATCSTALLDIQLNGLPAGTQDLVLKRGTEIKSRNDLGTQTFLVASDVEMTSEITGKFFRNVQVKQGEIVVNRYIVNSLENPRAIFTIPNENIDLDTLRVFVRESTSSLSVQEFYRTDDIVGLTGEDKIFFVQESYEELFQIYFGDDIIGKQVANGNEIVVSYFVCSGDSDADGCKVFSLESYGEAQSTTVLALSPSAGGKGKETVDELRDQIVKSFAAQNRAVTTDDYALLLKKKIPYVKNVRVWGGEDNVPPVYGKVFLSIQPEDGFRITESAKENFIKPEIERFNMLTVIPEIIDPAYTYLTFDVVVKFKQGVTLTTKADMANIVTTVVNDYIQNDVATFNKDFSNSRLTEKLLDSDPGVFSVTVSTRNNFRIRPIIGIETNYYGIENNKIKPSTISSSFFKITVDGNVRIVRIIDDIETIRTQTDRLGRVNNIADLYLQDVSTLEYLKSVGTIRYDSDDSAESGIFSFDLAITDFLEGESEIIIYYETVEEDVTSLRNQILLLDGNVGNADIGVLKGLTVRIEDYEK